MAGTIRPRNELITVERADLDAIRPPIETTDGLDLTGVAEILDTIGHHREDTAIRSRIIITGTGTDIRGLIITGTGGTGNSRACYLLNGTNELSSQQAVR